MSENINYQIFETFAKQNVGEYSKKKDTLDYLPWAKAWEITKKHYPDAEYKIIKNEQGLPYFASELGIMVYTEVTMNGLTYQMWLPVMDGKNQALKMTPHVLHKRKKNQQTKQYTEWDEDVPAATMMDVNKTIMRCLVKNLAMFGVGLHLYEGEDVSIIEGEAIAAEAYETNLNTLLSFVEHAHSHVDLTRLWINNAWAQKDDTFKQEMFEKLFAIINKTATVDELRTLYTQSQWAQTNPEFLDVINNRKIDIES